MTTYLSKREYTNAKTRLTKAENKLKRAEGVQDRTNAALDVIAEVDETFAEWDRLGRAYPDAWHRWQRAREDAQMLVLRLERW